MRSRPTEQRQIETRATSASSIQEAQMSVPELMTLTYKHWKKYLPSKVRELQASGELNEAVFGAASLAQMEIDHLKKAGYSEQEAREVALRQFVLLPEETDEDDEQAQELADMEAEYQKNPPVTIDPGEDLPVR
jgi:hypothetical protein